MFLLCFILRFRVGEFLFLLRLVRRVIIKGRWVLSLGRLEVFLIEEGVRSFEMLGRWL